MVDLNILSPTEERVWNCLRKAKGTESAVTSRQLSSWLGIDRRRVRATIRSLREKGLPIASSSNGIQGYFIPENEEEAEICRRHLESRIREIAKVIRALDRSFPGEVAQGVLFGEGQAAERA